MKRIAQIGLLLVAVLLPGSAAAQPPAPGGAAPVPPRGPTAAVLADQTMRFSVDALNTVSADEAHTMRLAGVQMVRFTLSWAAVQRLDTEPSVYNWATTDPSLAALAAEGIDV